MELLTPMGRRGEEEKAVSSVRKTAAMLPAIVFWRMMNVVVSRAKLWTLAALHLGQIVLLPVVVEARAEGRVPST